MFTDRKTFIVFFKLNSVPRSKPAIYIDGNMHTGEQTGAMLTLYMIWHLLSNYGKDAQATRLV